MSLVHLHLMLNHVPVVGLILITLLLGVALWRNSSETAKVALAFAAAMAAVAAIVFLTGEPAEEAVEGIAGISEGAIHRHEEAAEGALWATLLAGAIGLVGLAVFWKRAMPRWTIGVAIAVMLGASGVMGWAANLGGQIRHTEIGTGAVSRSEPGENDH